MKNRLICGDCLDVMQGMSAESVALIYADPPHLSQNEYRGESGWQKDSELCFSDKWRWDGISAESFEKIASSGPSEIRVALMALKSLYGESSELAYSVFLAARLIEMRRLLDSRGSLFLHLGESVAHIGKILLNSVFGSKNLRNVIIWHKSGGGRSRRTFSHKYDVIFWYSKTGRWRFNADAVRIAYKETSGYAKSGITAKSGKRYEPNPKGMIPDDVWYIPMVNPLAKERAGYPTQKPESLLERIVLAASEEGEVVLDPFCGSGTALVVAARMKRRFIGIDESKRAVELTENRLKENVPSVEFELEEVRRKVYHKVVLGGMEVRIRIFSRKSCPNCETVKQMVSKFIESRNLHGLVKIESHDLDTVDGLAEGAYWDVMSVPTLIVMRGGNVLARWDGAVPKEEEIEKVLR
ncbi:MAG: DNA methyltransferase [Planctomycetota bacterium]|nr:DNA methyltransferase [Planctomycetota bacterium]